MNLNNKTVYRNIIIELSIIVIITIYLVEEAVHGGYIAFSFVLIGLLIITSTFFGLVFLIINKKIAVYLLFFAFAGMMGVFFAKQIRENQIRINKQNGNNLISAIEKYYSLNKHYPFSINEVSPKYINTIPSVKNGLFRKFAFNYHNNEIPNGKASYILKFEVGGTTYYYSENKTWVIADS
jgi:hypothetical protein